MKFSNVLTMIVYMIDNTMRLAAGNCG